MKKRALEDGTIEYRNEAGELHREDGPAVEGANGKKEWWVDGLRHREDGPAVEGANGKKEWYRDGLRHREDGPAMVWPGWATMWFRNGGQIDPPSLDEDESPGPGH